LATNLEDICKAQGVEVLGQIPYDPVVTEAMVQGLPVTDYESSDLTNILQKVWQRARERLSATEAISV
jgi:MinD superfamily P-loop ATPase